MKNTHQFSFWMLLIFLILHTDAYAIVLDTTNHYIQQDQISNQTNNLWRTIPKVSGSPKNEQQYKSRTNRSEIINSFLNNRKIRSYKNDYEKYLVMIGWTIIIGAIVMLSVFQLIYPTVIALLVALGLEIWGLASGNLSLGFRIAAWIAIGLIAAPFLAVLGYILIFIFTYRA